MFNKNKVRNYNNNSEEILLTLGRHTRMPYIQCRRTQGNYKNSGANTT